MFLLAPAADADWESPKTVTRTLRVTHQQGLHLRPCSAIATIVGRHLAKVTIRKGTQFADAASILELLLLAASQGTELVLSATGPEAEEVLEAVVALFSGSPLHAATPREPRPKPK